MTTASQRDSEPANRPRIVIGLTGPIASGKSTVARMLEACGAAVIDADAVYRSLLVPGSELSRRIAARFGPAVVRPNGAIDRGSLGELVFSNPRALADLDRLTHPIVVAEVRRLIAGSKAAVVVVEAIKLVQSGMMSDIDSLWIVTALPEIRLHRLMKRTGLAEDAARQRLAAAVDPLSLGLEPDVTIDNSGNLDETARQVRAAWNAVVGVPERCALAGWQRESR